MCHFITSMEWLSKPRIIAGIMTGTSLDGIDVAIAEFSTENNKHHFKLISANTFNYSDTLKNQIINLINNKNHIEITAQVHFRLAKEYSDAIFKLFNNSGLKIDKLDAVGIHGQTVWHRGFENIDLPYSQPVTLQLGGISALSKFLNTVVVGNFREADVALGGQGAPLVPIFDYEFLREKENYVIALNIGGMSNITLIPANCIKEQIMAFDTGPGNVWVDFAVKKLFNLNFDTNGDIASSGTLIPEMLNKLKEIDFIKQKPPKSTGRELFSSSLANDLIIEFSRKNSNNESLLTTFSYYTAWSIAENLRLFGNKTAKIIASGGGTRNNFLIGLLEKELPDAKIIISDYIGIPSDFKESICFAYLTYLTLGGLPGNLPTVTGASKETILGLVAFPD